MRGALIALAPCALAACSSDPGLPTGEPPPREPPPHTVGGFRVELPEVTLQPGEESLPCYIFPIEIQGSSRIVGGAVLSASPGLHHGNVTTRRSTGMGVRECPPGEEGSEGTDVANGGTVLFASSTQLAGEEWYSFPEGMGYRVNDTHEIVARMHYINAGDVPLVVAPTYEWFTIDEARLVHELAPFFWSYGAFTIPPRSELTVTGECRLPGDEHPMHIVTILPHMHKLGTELWAAPWGGAHDGERFLDSPGYDPEDGVLTQFDPAIDLSDAEGFRFSCTWNNTFDKEIVEGIGDNEMCMVFGYAWPRDHAYNGFANEAGCLVIPTP